MLERQRNCPDDISMSSRLLSKILISRTYKLTAEKHRFLDEDLLTSIIIPNALPPRYHKVSRRETCQDLAVIWSHVTCL